jgi:uncharacterized membrane protein YcaP (DUF421 family)
MDGHIIHENLHKSNKDIMWLLGELASQASTIIKTSFLPAWTLRDSFIIRSSQPPEGINNQT